MTYIPGNVSVISENNVSTGNLSEDAVYTGTMEAVANYSSITVNIKSNVSSANGGISIEFGPDASTQNIVIRDSYIGPGNYNKVFNVQAPYFRIVYTNGDTGQNSFNLQCVLNSTKQGGDMTPQQISFPSAAVDAFARLRTSSPYTLFQVSHNSDKQMHDIAEKLTNNATSVYISDQSAVDLTVTVDSGSEAIRQSRMYCTYQPGKSFLMMATGVLNSGNANGTNCVSKIGLFDDQNGIYFQHTGGSPGTISVVMRSKVTGTVVDTVIDSTSWNLDRMDGTGPSGISIDAQYAQIFIIDLEWLGVGKVRCGIVVNGTIHYCHQFINTNNKTTTYMTRASLPVRYQINGGGSGAGVLKMICSTVISEGGYEPLGLPFSIGLEDGEAVECGSGTPADEKALIAIRLKSGHERVLCKLYGASLLATTSANATYKIYHWLSPTDDPFTTPTNEWQSVSTHSAMEALKLENTSTFSTTGAMVMNQSYMSNNADFSYVALDRVINITADIDGNSDIIALVAQNVSGSTEDILGSLQWSEFHT